LGYIQGNILQGNGLHLGKCSLGKSLTEIPSQLPNISCPYCTLSPVNFERVNQSEKLKSYDDSPRILAHLLKRTNTPLKIGDSFEAMKAKMISFEDAGYKKQIPLEQSSEEFDSLNTLETRPNTSQDMRASKEWPEVSQLEESNALPNMIVDTTQEQEEHYMS
jgi:hypothetical protein